MGTSEGREDLPDILHEWARFLHLASQESEDSSPHPDWICRGSQYPIYSSEMRGLPNDALLESHLEYAYGQSVGTSPVQNSDSRGLRFFFRGT